MKQKVKKKRLSVVKRGLSVLLTVMLVVGMCPLANVVMAEEAAEVSEGEPMENATETEAEIETEVTEEYTEPAIELLTSADAEGLYSISIAKGDDGSDESAIAAGVEEGELQWTSFADTPYWKHDGNGGLTAGDSTDYNLFYDSGADTLHLKNLNLSVTASADGNAIFAAIDLKLALEGTNTISCTDIAVMTLGNLDLSGSGSLTVSVSGDADMPSVFVGGNVNHSASGTVAFQNGGLAFFDPDEADDVEPEHEVTGDGTFADGSLPSDEPDWESFGNGIILTDEGMTAEGLDASSYYLNAEAGALTVEGADASNYSVRYVTGADANTLYLNGLALNTTSWTSAIAYRSEKKLIIEVSGKNSISSEANAVELGQWEDADVGNEEIRVSNIIIRGGGTLQITSTQVEEETETYYGVPFIAVCDSFENSAVITLKASSNAYACGEITADAQQGKVKNTGSISCTGGKEGGISVWGVGYVSGMSWNSTIAKSDMPATDTEIGPGKIGRCYYIYGEETYPNEHMAVSAPNAVIHGKYDAAGNPIPSNIVIQTVTYDMYNVPYMDDFVAPEWWLVYEDEIGSIDDYIKPYDIVSVCDGKKHTFNTDIYRAWIENGDVTINGNVICDIALFEAPCLEGEKVYTRDENGNIIFLRNSAGAKVTVNGDVGFLGLNSSFDGDVVIKGAVFSIALYDDINVKDGFEAEETAVYGAYAPGQASISKGKLTTKALAIGGSASSNMQLTGYGVYEGTTYTQIIGREGTQEVKGTTGVLDGKAVLVSVSLDSVTEGSAPMVKEAPSSDKQNIEAAIGKGKTYFAFDLSLIENNQSAVQPTSEMDVYITNTENFTDPVVCYVQPDGTLVPHDTRIVNGKIAFKTTHLSTYVIIEAADLPKTNNAPLVVKNENSTDAKTPNTGDTFPVAMLIMVMLTSLAGFVFMLKKEK
ncbi:MAG: hypothetical protein NC393_14565 [Clostridium sp.]|nr:hypothetical protein [Clostridium sp.]MCM1173336.1 hypothetical protein [Clostridium sp.]MCM1209948.1 hypothetical protein [Ruminococcus sp.]